MAHVPAKMRGWRGLGSAFLQTGVCRAKKLVESFMLYILDSSTYPIKLSCLERRQEELRYCYVPLRDTSEKWRVCVRYFPLRARLCTNHVYTGQIISNAVVRHVHDLWPAGRGCRVQRVSKLPLGNTWLASVMSCRMRHGGWPPGSNKRCRHLNEWASHCTRVLS